VDRDLNTQEVNPKLASNIVKILNKEGRTLKEIGGLMKLSESYISLVKNELRSFTIERLSMLEKALKQPLPILIIKANDYEDTPEELRPGYDILRKHMEKLPAQKKKLLGLT
jgi:transcriptional regulator with XRE-family HTH domain